MVLILDGLKVGMEKTRWEIVEKFSYKKRKAPVVRQRPKTQKP
jgi:hypothetical protein